MTRREALVAMRESLHSGTFPGGIDGPARTVWPYHEDASRDRGLMAHEAFTGSLDAARDLHVAALGHHVYYEMQVWNMPKGAAMVQVSGDRFAGHADAPARAWLLAIIEMLIAKEADNA